LNCEFADTSKEVKSQIIQGCHSTRLRRKVLRDDTDLTELRLPILFKFNKLPLASKSLVDTALHIGTHILSESSKDNTQTSLFKVLL
jgi:hypothetical protein